MDLMSGILFAEFFSFYDLFYNWESIGVFDLLLPFLLIFAVLFAVLTNTRILGDHKGINAIISIVISLFVIRVGFVSEFLGVMFANLGIALAALIVLMILTGLFFTKGSSKAIMKTWMYLGFVAVAVVIIATLNQVAWFGSFWWQENWLNIVWIAVIGIALIAFFDPGNTTGDWSEAKPVRKILEAIGGD